MPRGKLAARIERGVSELQNLIREQHPDVEFRIQPRTPGRNQVVVEMYGNFEDQTELTDIISERAVDLLIETGVIFIFMARPYDRRPSLKQQKSA